MISQLRRCFFHWEQPDSYLQTSGWQDVNWRSVFEIIIFHIGALSIFFVGYSFIAVMLFLAIDFVLTFSVTGMLHRYFSHHSFKMTRKTQLVFALLSLCTLQRGPLWWVSNHHKHHLFTDKEGDPHTPRKGFIYSYIGWLISLNNAGTNAKYVKRLAKYPELIWCDRLEWLAAPVLIVLAYLLGDTLKYYIPTLGTSGMQMIVWLVCLPTVLVLHGSCMVNTFSHTYGYRRFDTDDDSKNMLLLALISFGEGLHNNHHRYSHSCRLGVAWWEVDISYYTLKILEKMGVIWDLKCFPKYILEEGKNTLRTP